MGKAPQQAFFQRHTNGQQVHEKVLHITNHQGNVHQNHSEMPLSTCWDGCYQKHKR